MKTLPDQDTIDQILLQIRSRFYHDNQKLFFRDRRFLLYVITWPASWLNERGLHTQPDRYKEIVLGRLKDIETHGVPDRYMPFFPRYFLKCLQDYFAYHGDSLYQELKHIRNALCSVEAFLETLSESTASKTPSNPPQDHNMVEILAHAHHILASQYRHKPKGSDSKQLSLF